MLLAALGVSAATRAGAEPDDDARVLDALAASPRQLGLSASALAAIVARLLIQGRIVSTADGRLTRR